ncbi:MAG: nucleotidyltransferase family protein [Actinobacteria bacterium]|nr:nucleotidyltransferase family protein [Actinomycetota bacterium]
MRTLGLDRATAEVVLAWRRAGVRCVLLKGPALTRWLYREDEIRGYADIDLLVPVTEVEAAEEVLKGLGFARDGIETIEGDWPRYSRNWVRKGDSINIDLHQTMAGVGVPPVMLWDALTEGLEQMTVAGVDVDVLAPPARALALALHTAKDGPRIAKARHDLGHAIDRLPPNLWIETVRFADRVGALGGLAAGLRLLVPSGVELADRLGLPAGAPLEIAIRSKGGAPALSLGIDWLVSSPGVRGKGRLVLRKIFPPASFVRAWSPLARRGRVGLVAAYAYRPLWVLWHAGPALWALARVRRQTRSDR